MHSLILNKCLYTNTTSQSFLLPSAAELERSQDASVHHWMPCDESPDEIVSSLPSKHEVTILSPGEKIPRRPVASLQSEKDNRKCLFGLLRFVLFMAMLSIVLTPEYGEPMQDYLYCVFESFVAHLNYRHIEPPPF